MSRHLRSNGLTAVDQEHWWVIQDLNLHSDGLKVRCVTITPMTHMEGYMGIEPTSPAWKAGIIAIIPIPHGGTYRIRTGVTAIPMPYTWPTILTHHKSRYSPLYSLQIPQTPHLSSRRSTRFVGQGMEVRQGFEPWFEHYKCPVIAIILSHQMEARVDHDSTSTDYETAILPSYTISPNGAGWR